MIGICKEEKDAVMKKEKFRYPNHNKDFGIIGELTLYLPKSNTFIIKKYCYTILSTAYIILKEFFVD